LSKPKICFDQGLWTAPLELQLFWSEPR
jgi:hypothetical protein